MRKILLEIRGKRFLSSNQDPCYVVVKKMSTVTSDAWQVENAAKELSDLAKEISRQTFEGAI